MGGHEEEVMLRCLRHHTESSGPIFELAKPATGSGLRAPAN